VLISCNESRWTISYNPDKAPVTEPQTTEPGPHALGPARADYELIRAQLLDATERYCSTQGRAVMAELERRLLARQQTAAFVTFLVSIILLNCVERMSLLYRTFDPRASSSEGQLLMNGTEPSPPSTPPDWPLDAPPSAFWTQGQSFANLLHLLLRLRALPPRTIVRDNGTLMAIINGKPGPTAVSGDGSHADHVDTQQVMMAQWVDSTGVLAEELVAARDVGNDVVGSSRVWDLRFIAALLLPENV